MATISVCLIVKNEREYIENCINSLEPFADEIVIYDTGSNDGTQNICRKMDKVKLIQGGWMEDFAWARNESFKYATCDYIMWVDADDIVDEHSQNWLIEFKKENLSKYASVFLIYRYGGDCNFYRGRIFNRLEKPLWHSRIHETVSNSIINNTSLIRYYYVPQDLCYITHKRTHVSNPKRNYEIFKDMESKGELTTGRDWFYYANECKDLGRYDEAIENYNVAIGYHDIWNIDKLNALMSIYRLISNDDNLRGEQLEYLLRAAACTNRPRADVCCELGMMYYKMGEFDLARQWELWAIDNIPQGLDGTFMDTKYYTWIPYSNLCIIEWYDGHKDKSKEYNDKVLEIDPTNAYAIGNKGLYTNI